MNKAELALELMKLAIKDSGLTTTEFVDRLAADPGIIKNNVGQLKARVLAGERA